MDDPLAARANENLRAAELCLEHDYRFAAASRAYYAIFQAAVSFLEAHGMAPAQERWRHGQVAKALRQPQFSMHHEVAERMEDAYAWRRAADYMRDDLRPADVGRAIVWATAAVAALVPPPLQES